MIRKIILFISPFIFLLILLARPDQAFTQDLGRHIKMGEIILSCRCVPTKNLFSFTQPDHPFLNHHWLSEVLFSVFFHYLGQSSLLLLKIVLIFLSFGIIYWYGFKKNAVWVCILAIPYLFILSERFDTRPELFSFLFLSLFTICLLVYRKTRNIWYLIPLIFIELLWVNMHIYFIFGILLFGMLVLEEIIHQVLEKRKTVPHKVVYFICLGLIGITLLNPNGISGALEPLQIFQNYGYSIVENQNIFFLNSFFFNPHILVFEIVSLLLVGLVLFNAKKLGIFPVGVSLLSVIAGYEMIRNFPIFIFVTFPIAILALVELEKHIKTHEQKNVIRGIAGVVSLILGIWSIFALPSFSFSYAKGAEDAVTFFKENHLHGPIFNNFDIGSYLIFTLYPQEKVFVDGRPEAYSLSFFDEYKKAQENQLLFEKLEKKYTINTIFFAHTDITPWAQSFLGFIIKNPHWAPVYIDEKIIIFVRNLPENKTVVDKYKKSL